MAHPTFRAEIDREAVAAFLRYSYVPTPATIFRGVQKLPPGCILIDARRRRAGDQAVLAPERGRRAAAARRHVAPTKPRPRSTTLLREAVRGRMIADVPIGAFLSGGVDSSTVVALMQACSDRPVRTFTIGFREAAYDEAPYARDIASASRHRPHRGHARRRRRARAGRRHRRMVRRAVCRFLATADLSRVAHDAPARHRRAVRRRRRRTVRRLSEIRHAGEDLAHASAACPAALRALAGRCLDRACRNGRSRRRPACMLDAGRAERIGEKTRRFAAALGGTSRRRCGGGPQRRRHRSARSLVPGASGSLQPAAHAGPRSSVARSRLAHAGRGHGRAICRTTSSPRSTAARWRCRSKRACRCSITASSNSSGRCRARIRRGREPKALLKSVLARYLPLVIGRAAEARLFRAARPMAGRPAARLGGGPAVAGQARQ